MSKKDFSQAENPAMAFISSAQQQETPRPNPVPTPRVPQTGFVSNNPPRGFKPDPQYIETKSRRVQLMLQPSLVHEVKRRAQKKGMSMNELINQAIQEYLERHL